MQNSSNDLARELALLKLETLEQRIQAIQIRASEIEAKLSFATDYYPNDLTAQVGYLREHLDVPGNKGWPSHSLLDTDLDRIRRDQGEDSARQYRDAQEEFATAVVAGYTMARNEGEFAEVAGGFSRVLRAVVKLLRIELMSATMLQRDLLGQLKPSDEPRVRVCLETSTIFVAEVAYPVESQHAVFLSLLLEKVGVQVSSTEMVKHPQLEGCRIDRLRDELEAKYRVPLEIESKRGTGFWIPVE